MNIMILGHKDNGKTTLAKMLSNKFGFRYVDTTDKILKITRTYIQANKTAEINTREFNRKYVNNKDSVRSLMKEALRHYTQKNPARLIKEQYEECSIYAGCRSNIEYEAAKNLIDFTFWIQDPRKEENDPSMDIVFNPDTMIHINNNGTLLQLECNVKHALYRLAGISIRSHDITLRDSIVSNMKHTIIPSNNRTE